VNSDRKRYILILYNLLTNAVKYTRQGEIRITVHYDPALSMVYTSVADTGIGISEANLQQLFKLYANVERANQHNPQGMGLGLTLCRKLSQMLGGDISVTSTLGAGSTFRFSIKHTRPTASATEVIPRIPVQELCETRLRAVRLFAPRLDTTIPIGKTASPTRRVLLVDDEALNRRILRVYLKHFEAEVEEADNGRVALEAVKRGNPYRLILMDINMPEMDGVEATKKLVEMFTDSPQLRAPIVAVTAAVLQSRFDVQDLLSVGFEDISKLLL
jgi:CheY-like chemotaxis protein